MRRRNPNRAEKIIIGQLTPRLNINNWFVVAKSANTMTLQHKRYSRIYINLQLKEGVV